MALPPQNKKGVKASGMIRVFNHSQETIPLPKSSGADAASPPWGGKVFPPGESVWSENQVAALRRLFPEFEKLFQSKTLTDEGTCQPIAECTTEAATGHGDIGAVLDLLGALVARIEALEKKKR